MPSRVPPSPDRVRDLEILFLAHHPLLFLESVEEERVEALLRYVAEKNRLPFLVWEPGRGLRRVEHAEGTPIHGTEDAAHCLAFVERANQEAVYFLRGITKALEEPENAVRLKSIYRKYFEHRGAVVLSGSELAVAPDLEPLFTTLALGEPSDEAYYHFVTAVLRDVRQRRPIEVDLTSEDVTRLLQNLRGLTFLEVRKILTRALVEDGRFSREDVDGVLDAKRRIIQRSGVLEYFPADEGFSDIAGLANLKAWLRKRAASFVDPERARSFGLPPPKGLLLLGVQGCGKSLCAKAVAREWGLPLVRLDPAGIYQKYFGETEKNFRRAIRTAETMAPIVLWIDEIEKAFSQGSDSDNGTSQRVFGTFLSWLQEKDERVFVLATANDVSGLPPELMRKGRFDEIFFVDLPDADVRREIFRVHLRRRGRVPEDFDLDALAEAADGFSGAEIEQAVISSLYTVFSENEDLSTGRVLEEIRSTRPLSVTMAEKIEALRAWAKGRAVAAE